MGKNKAGANPGGGKAQKHIHARISYLYRAALYLEDARKTNTMTSRDIAGNPEKGSVQKLASASAPVTAVETTVTSSQLSTSTSNLPSLPRSELVHAEKHVPPNPSTSNHPSSRSTTHLLASLRAVSQRAQIRLPQEMKRAVCRRCGEFLQDPDGVVENLSRGGKKSCADVRVVKCARVGCGVARRFPVGERRVKRVERVERRVKRRGREMVEGKIKGKGKEMMKGKGKGKGQGKETKQNKKETANREP